MKKLLFAALLVITSLGAQAQIQRPGVRPQQQPMVRMPLLPKPEQIIDRGDKVILIFTKADWLKYQRIKKWHYQRNRRKHVTEIGLQKRVEHNYIRRDSLGKNPKSDK